jgi:hypothetical protein
MRKLVVTENITLDGVIDASEGWFAPVGDEEVDQSDLNEALREQAVVLGRGARLFGDVTSVPKLKLVDSRAFRSGVVLTSYSTGG